MGFFSFVVLLPYSDFLSFPFSQFWTWFSFYLSSCLKSLLLHAGSNGILQAKAHSSGFAVSRAIEVKDVWFNKLVFTDKSLVSLFSQPVNICSLRSVQQRFFNQQAPPSITSLLTTTAFGYLNSQKDCQFNHNYLRTAKSLFMSCCWEFSYLRLILNNFYWYFVACAWFTVL